MSQRAINAMFLFIAALMIATVLRTTPTLLEWLALVPPFIALWAFWGSIQHLNRTASLLEKSVKEDDRVFHRMRQQVNIVVAMGLFGIIVAVFAGFSIGREAAHLPALWIHR